MGIGSGKSFGGGNPIRPSLWRVCWVYRESCGKSGNATMLMFPETIEPLYCPPWRFFSLLGGNAALGGFGVRPLLFTRIEDGSNPVPLPFPMKSLPSAKATAEGYWPVGINPRTFDFARLTILSAFFRPRTLSESSKTAMALLWAFATYKVCSSSLSASPEGLALSDDEQTLYVANAHSNAIAVLLLSDKVRGRKKADKMVSLAKSKVLGFIPTGQYPSAVAFADGKLFIGNGKGTGFEPSSMRVNNNGRTPNPPNAAFPPNKEKNRQGGQYSGSIVSGNISMVALPDLPQLSRYTQQTLHNDGLMGLPPPKLFPEPIPIKHVIYIIKENRTYDQVFGDVKGSGDGTAADGEPAFAIFGNGATAQRPSGAPQTVTPNHHALAQRFGLFDRFFVNSEASPAGHNWATAAFSTDYVDKALRWNYSGRGRTYDFEG